MYDCSFFQLKNIHGGLSVPSLVLVTRKVKIKTTVSSFRTAHGLVGEGGS